MRRSALVFSLVLAAACSAPSVTTTLESSADAGAPHEGAPREAGVDAGPGSGDAQAAHVDATATDAGASPADDRIDPLEIGRTWTYEVTTTGSFPVCSAGTHSSSVVGTAHVDGRDALQVTSFCEAAGTSNMTVRGDEVEYDYNGTWLHATGVPIQEGTTWSYFNTSFTWEKVPSLTVPAGTFSDCWKARQNVPYAAYTVYCRGVGVVRSYSLDAAGSGWDARLSAKNF